VKYKRIYELLKANGHSAAVAAVIIRAARRKDLFSLNWIKTFFKGRHSK